MGYGGKIASRSGDVRRFNFTGNGSNTAFDLGFSPATQNQLIITINGVVQHYDAFSVSGSVVTFTGTPAAGDYIQVTAVVDAIGVTGIPDGAIANVSSLKVTTTPVLIGNAVGTFSNPIIQAASTANSWIQINAQNLNNGNNASTDAILARSDGNDNAGYIDMGINSNTYSQAAYSIMTPNSGYVFVNGGDLVLGTQTAHNIIFHTGNTTASSERLRITSNGAIAFPDGTQFSTASSFGMRNRVINGAMAFDQRASGNPQTGVTGGAGWYLADRFRIGGSALTTGRLTFQQVVDAPAGFKYSGKITTTAAQTTTTETIVLSHIIEGLNTLDLGWGTASAANVTLSFWVKASLTGTYPVAVRCDNANATYVATYTINSANTWQYITLNIPGPTFGTWSTTNANGIRIDWDLGSGTNGSSSSAGNVTTTPNAWQTYDAFRTSTSVQLQANLNATWQITGIQFERGNVATPFEARSFSTELALCQRYYQIIAAGSGAPIGIGAFVGTTDFRLSYMFPVQMRAAPSGITCVSGTGYYRFYWGSGVSSTFNGFVLDTASPQGISMYTGGGLSGVTAGQSGFCLTNNTAAYLAANADL